MATLTLGNALLSAFAGTKLQRHKARSGAPHPTGARVLRDSVEAGTFEHVFFVAPAKGETDRQLRAARRILDAGRQLRSEARRDGRTLSSRERLLTTFTSAGLRVFEEILTLSRLNNGRVYPSYDYLAKATSLGRATVARSLRILEEIGFLVRQRRFKRLADAQGPGPRFEQTSNAYRTFLPQLVLDYLPRWMRPAPIPDDVQHREFEHGQEMERMRSQLTCRELAETTVNGALGKALARLGEALDRQERESQIDTQPLPDKFINSPIRTSSPNEPSINAARKR